MHILVVDDEASIRHLVKLQLELDGQTVETAADGAAALALQATQTFDLIVLDLMLPDTTGFDLIPKLRQTTPDLPILMLTARDQMNDKIIGLQLGADDYMTKPFNGTELVLRVKNLLKRTKTVAPPVPVASDPFLSVDPEERVIRLDGQPLPLTYREYALLALFLTHPKRVFERDELLEQVWGFDFSVRPVPSISWSSAYGRNSERKANGSRRFTVLATSGSTHEATPGHHGKLRLAPRSGIARPLLDSLCLHPIEPIRERRRVRPKTESGSGALHDELPRK